MCVCVFVYLSLCIQKYMCETAVVRGRAGKQAISALHLCQQSHTDVHTPHDGDDDDGDGDDDF